MQLTHPYLRTEGKYFADYIKLWESFASTYNRDRKLGQQLRGYHKQMYFALVHLSKKTIFKNNKILSETGLNSLESTEPLSIRSSRAYLGKVLSISGSSVCRHIQRLEQAGVLTKIHHGPCRPFELLINPDFLLIFDYNNENYIPTSKYLEPENSGLQEQPRSNCTDVSSCSQEHVNKKIITVDNSTDMNKKGVPPAGDRLQEHTGTDNRNTQKQENPDKNSKQNFKNFSPDLKSQPEQKKEKSCGKKEKKPVDLDRLRSSLAHRLYFLMVELLFKTHNIYEVEKENAIMYIERVYMAGVRDNAHGEKTLEHYRWRLEKAANYIRRKEFDFSNIYPMHYLDVNNPKGFVATKAWAQRSEKELYRKKIERITNHKRLTDRKKLERTLKEFNTWPNLRNYNICYGYIKHNIPHLLNEFIAGTNIRIQPNKQKV